MSICRVLKRLFGGILVPSLELWSLVTGTDQGTLCAKFPCSASKELVGIGNNRLTFLQAALFPSDGAKNICGRQ